jgi:hypothetical protein
LAWENRVDLRRNPRYAAGLNIYQSQLLSDPCTCGARHSVQGVEWHGVHRPITFAYRHGTEKLGNVLLRGFQVADMLRTLGAPVPVTVQPIENLYRSRPRGHTIIVLKTAVRPRSIPLLKSLHRRRNVLLFDLVDDVQNHQVESLADGFICASVTEDMARQANGQLTIRSLQSPDQRTPSFPFNERPFSTVYYGLPENARHLAALTGLDAIDFVDMPPHRSGQAVPGVFDTLKSYSHHYSVRAWNDRDGFKPMMKGFFAGRLGAVVIASAEDEESRVVLGDSYPYLAASSTLEDVQQILAFAQETHRKAEWRAAAEKMTELREVSCPVPTARALVDGLRRLFT